MGLDHKKNKYGTEHSELAMWLGWKLYKFRCFVRKVKAWKTKV